MDVLFIFRSACLLISASFTFAYLFLKAQKYVRLLIPKEFGEAVVVSISMRCVSALQGALCTLSGLVIINSCDDLVHEIHWLTNTYVLIGTGYLMYDVWATYVCYIHQNPSVGKLPLLTSIGKFFRKDPAMMFHHLCLPIVYLPTVMYYRRGVGDGLIGCFMLIEATVPFISFREILVLLKKQKSLLYIVNGVLVLTMYTASRILIFPWMFWIYGRQIDLSWYEVPFQLHKVCIIGTGVFVGLYVYWWFYIFGIAKGELVELLYRGKKEHRENGVVSTEGVGGVDGTASRVVASGGGSGGGCKGGNSESKKEK